MVVIDRPALFVERRLDGRDHRRHFLRRFQPRLPAGAEARGAADRRLTGAAEPHRQVGAERLRRNHGVVVAIELTVEIDRILDPQAGDDLEHLVAAPAAPRRVGAHGFPVGGADTADAEAGQEAARAQHVDGGALFGEQQRIAQAERQPHSCRI